MSSSSHPPVERAQPWLGTLVSMRVTGLCRGESDAALDAAFQEVAQVHRLMSFHDKASDVSRMNVSESGEAIQVHPYTYAVLERAQQLSALTAGCFDITVGAQLVEWSLLPSDAARAPRHDSVWADIELLGGASIRLRRPVCVDLGGIAKGFAVDKATECLQAHGADGTVVNAGGDIRVSGPDAEWIALAVDPTPEGAPVIELENASLASSCGALQRRYVSGRQVGPHVDGVLRRPARTDRFVSVVSQQCILADALTKVVMVKGMEADRLLHQLGATAYMHDSEAGWQVLQSVQESATR